MLVPLLVGQCLVAEARLLGDMGLGMGGFALHRPLDGLLQPVLLQSQVLLGELVAFLFLVKNFDLLGVLGVIFVF